VTIHAVATMLKPPRAPEQDEIQLCLRLDDKPPDCRGLDEAQSFHLTGLAPGSHCLYAWARDAYDR
jgi:hypothetical protein